MHKFLIGIEFFVSLIKKLCVRKNYPLTIAKVAIVILVIRTVNIKLYQTDSDDIFDEDNIKVES